MSDFQFPSDTQRTAIVGKTGSGKTHLGTWLLSHADYTDKPWIVCDFKREEFFRSVPYMSEIGFEKIPQNPGLYVIRPNPGDEDQVEQLFWNIWAQEHTGLFIDESYMIDKYSKSYRALLTQGRSKHIPMINLSQRPVDVPRYVFSEADHMATFFLNDKADRDIVERRMPLDSGERLPDYHSRWYDVGRDKSFRVHPAPSRDTILERFNTRLKPETPRRRFI